VTTVLYLLVAVVAAGALGLLLVAAATVARWWREAGDRVDQCIRLGLADIDADRRAHTDTTLRDRW
jgi:hypothetical protein